MSEIACREHHLSFCAVLVHWYQLSAFDLKSSVSQGLFSVCRISAITTTKSFLSLDKCNPLSCHVRGTFDSIQLNPRFLKCEPRKVFCLLCLCSEPLVIASRIMSMSDDMMGETRGMGMEKVHSVRPCCLPGQCSCTLRREQPTSFIQVLLKTFKLVGTTHFARVSEFQFSLQNWLGKQWQWFRLALCQISSQQWRTADQNLCGRTEPRRKNRTPIQTEANSKKSQNFLCRRDESQKCVCVCVVFFFFGGGGYWTVALALAKG